jgi:hypothetical protein
MTTQARHEIEQLRDTLRERAQHFYTWGDEAEAGGYECSASNRRGYASACVEAAEDLDSLLSALLAEVPPLTDGLLKAAWLDGFRDEHVRDEESAWRHSETRIRLAEAPASQGHVWLWDDIVGCYRCNGCLVRGDRPHGPICPRPVVAEVPPPPEQMITWCLCAPVTGGFLALNPKCPVHAQPAPPPEQGWRDIESAPKDGSEVILGRPGHVAFCFYGRGCGDRWAMADDASDLGWDPTHWQPLPSPPPEQRKEEQ